MKMNWIALLVAGVSASSAVAADCYWTGAGSDNRWFNSQNWSNGAPTGSGDNAIFPAGTPTSVLVDASTSIRTIYFRNPGMTLSIAAGMNLHIDNGGGLTIRAEENATINGPGTLTFSTGGGENWADNQAANGRTLTINAKITGTPGFEHNGSGGTIVLTNPNNNFQGCSLITAGGGISVPVVAAGTGAPSPLGTADIFKFRTAPSFLRYTGGTASTGLILSQEADIGRDATVEHAGTGTLTFTGPFRGNNNSHAFVLDVVDPSAVMDIGGGYANYGSGALWLYKRGAGTVRVSSACTHTGHTLVDQGVLDIAPLGSLGSGTEVRMRGGTLQFGASAAVNTLHVEGGASTFGFHPGVAAGTLAVASLNPVMGLIDFTGADLGGATRIIFSTPPVTGPDGRIGAWATVNGGAAYAAYAPGIGIYAANLTPQLLSALGPSVINSAPATAARITTIGTSGGISLNAPLTEVALLSQEVATPATVTFGGYALVSPLVQIALGGAGLTLGNASGDGALMPSAQDRLVVLRNANAAGGAALTVNAGTADNGGAARIEKAGPGDVVLAGPVAHTGGTWVNDGHLTISNAAAMTWPGGGISGNGGLIKTGPGTLSFPNAGNAYNGTTVIKQGIVSLLHGDTFGNKAAPTIIEDGGAIDFVGTGDQSLRLYTEEVIAQGAGPDGLGAIRNPGPYSQMEALRFLTLSGDLTVHTIGRLDVRNGDGPGALNMNGHRITKKGPDLFTLDAAIVNDLGTALIDTLEGTFHYGGNARFLGGPSNTIHLHDGAALLPWESYTPATWALDFDGGSRVETGSGYGLTANLWTGPVTLGTGTVTFRSGGDKATSDTYTGDISGPGKLLKVSSNDQDRGRELSTTYLRGTNSTWSGGTEIQSGILYAAQPGSLPGYASTVTVYNKGTLALRVAGADPAAQPGFTMGQINTILGRPSFQSPNASLGLDTAYGDLDYSAALPQIGIRKFGPNTLTLSGAGPSLGPISVHGGTLDLSPASRYLGDNNIFVGESRTLTDPLATLVVSGTARIETRDKGHQVGGQNRLTIGNNGRGIMRVSGDAYINGWLTLGEYEGSVGAVYQTGGTVHNTGGHSNDGRIGMDGYGYYLLAGGSLIHKGYSQVGRNRSGLGILHQTGGEFNFTREYDGTFGISRGGTGVLQLEGGTFYHNGDWWVGDENDNGGNGGYAAVTIAGNAQATINGLIDMNRRWDTTAILNLNGGELNAPRIRRINRGGNISVNWGGGLYRATSSDAELFSNDNNGPYPEVTLFGRGAVIDIPDNGKSKAVNTPLRAPQGMGIVSIPVTYGGAGYLGAPHVNISGGGGRGASAFARVDLQSGTVTAIEVTSPGTGYIGAPSVWLSGGGASSAATLGTPVMTAIPSGGLTKLGGGTLTLNAPNTYTGPTEVRDGILKLGTGGAISPSASVTVTGGTLDLNGLALSNANVTATGGRIINGRIAAAAFTMGGPGTLTLSAPIVTGPSQVQPRTLTPGLYEGMIRSNWNWWDANPKDNGIVLTTRAANGGPQAWNGTYADGPWAGDNHTWIYSGFIWNNEDHPVTWTFFGRFDDNMLLVLDGKRIMDVGNGNDSWTRYTLTPGPHSFEARFGDGVGDVGPGPRADGNPPRTSFPGNGDPLSGLLVDYSGAEAVYVNGLIDLTNYQILKDPGDGSLFTIDLPDGPLPGPGLAEYIVLGNWNTTAYGTFVSRQLNLRAGSDGPCRSNNDYANGLWAGNNHTWIYKGTIHNRGDTDLVWTWRLSFDDNVMLKIDGARYGQELACATQRIPDVHLTPGTHDIEIRFGDGGGDVGPYGSVSGVMYDPQNRNSDDINCYISLTDPGDGSLLTTSPDWVPPSPFGPAPDFPTVNVTGGTLRLKGARDAGLLEGRLDGQWNANDPNPGTAIELGTPALNGSCGDNGSINGKPWPNNSTYVYTGYIWNNTGGPVTWTFAENFDDDAKLVIAGQTVLDNHTWNEPTIGSITLAPGPHAFEARFGQGGGGCAANIPNDANHPEWSWWTNGQMSFGVDFQGRGQTVMSNYEFLQDPGDGSLLTWTLSGAQNQQELLDTAHVNLSDTAILDLNGEAHQIGAISGNGTVINGTLAPGTILSPAGDDATGTLTIGSNVTLAPGITYRLTVDGASSDRLLSAGTLDLSGVTIVNANGAIPAAREYIIAHADGGFTGAKPTANGFLAKYKIIKKGHDLVLTSLGGTVLILR